MLGRGQTDKQQAEDGMAHLTDLGGRAGGGDLCEELVGGGDGLGPLFFVEPEVAPIAFDVLDSLIDTTSTPSSSIRLAPSATATTM